MEVLPWSFSSTHVFHYSRKSASVNLVLRGADGVWPPNGSSVLHLFSQEEKFLEAVKAAKDGAKMDDLKILNQLFDRNPGLTVTAKPSFEQMEQPVPRWGLKREDLLCLGEPPDFVPTDRTPYAWVNHHLVSCSAVSVTYP
jgi:hypothetical protein